MKVKHWLFLILALIGLLFVWHVYSGHGGSSGFKQGLGIG
jgi:hypothetical protein